MEKFKSFIRRQPTYLLVVVGIVLLVLTLLSPRYIGIIPGILAIATWFVVLGRAIVQSTERRQEVKRPWWTNW
jgi:hypothetical protein